MLSESEENRLVLQAVCPDKKCRSVLYFSYIQAHVDCLRCGQRHNRATLQDVQTPNEEAVKLWFRDILLTNMLPKRGPEMVKVLGLSNYYCKLLSPLLTKYGMDKNTGRAKLLSEMNQGEIFDCGLFGDRAFLIDQEHISIPGYGRDDTGSMNYLSETLEIINSFNEGEERLIPIHADGDGHCLVHAISRALVGRELFWHPLRCCLKRHFQENIQAYKELFKDFVDERDWDSIIDECDPEFRPPDGELHGLRNIHIFGLANVLKRPIILLDSLECMKKLGDYAALFLPGLVSPNACKSKDNSLNKPLCIAWSSFSHTHYIPLIGVKRRPLPVLPRELIPKVWGIPQTQIFLYMAFDLNGTCTLSGNRQLSDAYVHRLVSSMETLFFDQNNIHPSIVADAQLYLYPNYVPLPGSRVSTVVNKVKQAVNESRLYQCLNCNALCELLMEHNWLKKGGILYNIALADQKRLIHNSIYAFPLHGILCKYDRMKDELIPDPERTGLTRCTWCQYTMLSRVKSDGSILNKSETRFDDMEIDPEDYKSTLTEVCEIEQDSATQQISINIEWNGRLAKDVVEFNRGKRESITDTVYKIASEFVQKHFPGESNNQLLHCVISEQVLKEIKHPAVGPSPNIISSVSNENSNADKSIPENTKVISTSSLEAASNALGTSAKPEFVKVVTSDGEQASLTITDKGVSYFELQSWVERQFHIPAANQKIKLGYPPSEFNPTPNGNQLLPVQNGDRITVEICKTKQNNLGTSMDSVELSKSESIFPLFTADETLESLMEKLTKSELQWNLAKMTPSLFKKHGRFYDYIVEKYGKNDKKHAHLNGFPKKVFVYNSENDSIELCVKPHGHFPISCDIDYLIEETKRGMKVEGVRSCTLLPNYFPSNQTLLRTSKPSSALSDIENVQNQPSLPMIRKGPGFSVLHPRPPERNDKDFP